MNTSYLLKVGGTFESYAVSVDCPRSTPLKDPRRVLRSLHDELTGPGLASSEEDCGMPSSSGPPPPGKPNRSWLVVVALLSLLCLCTGAAGVNLVGHRREAFESWQAVGQQQRQANTNKSVAQWQRARSALSVGREASRAAALVAVSRQAPASSRAPDRLKSPSSPPPSRVVLQTARDATTSGISQLPALTDKWESKGTLAAASTSRWR